MTNKRKARWQPGSKQNTEQALNSTPEFSLPFPSCQAFTLSPDSLSRAAFLAGDLGCWLLARCPKPKPPFDPEFNPLFFKAVEYLEIEDQMLRKAHELELSEAGR